jgi:outer membrane protein assembly factor BamB
MINIVSIKYLVLAFFFLFCSVASQAQTELFRERLPLGAAGHSSVAVGDVVKDSTGLEIVTATSSSTVTVFSNKGKALWTTKLPNYLCLGAADNNKLYASPSIGDLDGDGALEIVIGYGGIDLGACAGGVAALRGEDGKKIWNFSIKRHSKRERYSAVYGTPTLGDVDGDGKLEIGFGSHDRNVYLLSFTGRIIHTFHAADTVFSSPVFANVDDDPSLEMIIGTDISRNKLAKTKNGGVVYALKLNGFGRENGRNRSHKLRVTTNKKQLRREFNLFNKKSYIWRRYLNQVVQSSPAVANLLSGSNGQDIVVGSGCYFPEKSANKIGKWVKVLSLRKGRVLKTLKTKHCVRSSPTVADLNGDGYLDVVVLVSSKKGFGGSDSEVIAWTPQTDRILWRHKDSDPNLGENGKQAVVADVNGDGLYEVIYGSGSTIVILEALSGKQESCSLRCLWSPLKLRSSTNNTPTIFDLTGDGKPEVIATARDLVVWSDFDREAIKEVNSSAILIPFDIAWGTWLFNTKRNSFFRNSNELRQKIKENNRILIQGKGSKKTGKSVKPKDKKN